MPPSFFPQNGRGKLAVIGSSHIFSDPYLDREENGKLQEVIFQWLTSDEIALDTIDAEDPEVLCHYWLMESSCDVTVMSLLSCDSMI